MSDPEQDSARLVKRVGALLGLRLRSREQLIFISYRAADGTKLARQLEEFLKGQGYNVWRDESQDAFDRETSILPGTPVQAAIESNLERADMVLLLDTPRAAESLWINLEVDFANGGLIPVLPLLFLAHGERTRTSRFRSLATLQRGCEFAAPAEGSREALSNSELERALNELETYLSEIFQRKLRVPFLVEREFTNRRYAWSKRDHFVYEALRRGEGILGTRVFSHCSYFEGVYDPAVLRFVQYLKSATLRANYALYIYDGALVPITQMDEIRRAMQLEEATDIIILHHQEVAALLQTNFTSLRVL